MKKIGLFVFLFLAAGAFFLTAFADEKSGNVKKKTGGPLKVLTANVGNADIFGCGKDYLFKLCMLDVEGKVGAAIRAIEPDIVALQEVYYDGSCAGKPADKNKKRLCNGYEKRTPKYQVERLLGDGYTIVCDGRANFECIGVRRGIGTVKGCSDGGVCFGAEAALTLPAPPGCEKFPVIFGVDAEIGGKPVRIINGHPSAAEAKCRAADVRNMFNGIDGMPPLADPKLRVIAMGDMNLDPFGKTEDESVKHFRTTIGKGKPFYYLSGPAENDPPHPTNAGRTIDHVFSNFAKGKCTTFGRKTEQPRLDGTVGDVNPAGTDHSPILCELEF